MIMRFVYLSVFAFSVLYGNDTSAWQADSNKTNLFNGTFEGWEGDTKNTWRIEGNTIVAGSMENPAPRNEFLCTVAKYSDFELTLQFKTKGTKKINAGVQFRSELLRKKKIENQPKPAQEYHEVVGYQADIGDGYHGCLYDEHRRRTVLSRPDKETDQNVAAAIPGDGWQSYRIRAVGDRVQLWLNGIQTVDYTETDDSVWRKGCIALQIHGNMVGTIAYRNIEIKDLSAGKKNKTAGSSNASAKYSIGQMDWIVGSWAGKALGGQFEETWNAPNGGEMMGMFKLVKGDKVVFYELLTIVPEKDSYVLRLKHFGPGLVGWEDKDKSVEFPLESVSKTEIKFKGLTFSRKSESVTDKMQIQVETKQGDKQESLIFDCHK